MTTYITSILQGLVRIGAAALIHITCWLIASATSFYCATLIGSPSFEPAAVLFSMMVIMPVTSLLILMRPKTGSRINAPIRSSSIDQGYYTDHCSPSYSQGIIGIYNGADTNPNTRNEVDDSLDSILYRD